MNKISSYTMLEILQAAGVETDRSGSNTVCNCPICKPGQDFRRGEHNAQINAETLHCFSENKTFSRTELIDLLNIRATLGIPEWEERPQHAHATSPEKEKKVIPGAIYNYCNLSGKLLYKRQRLEFADGSGKAGVIYKDKPADQSPVFYGLETLTDPENLNFIMFAEGAKCAQAVRAALADADAAGDTAVLAFDKPREWENIGTEAQNIILQKKIIIFADNDEPGQQNTAGLLKYLPTAEVVDFSDKPKAYDIADWLEDGGTVRAAMQKYGKKVEPEPDAPAAIVGMLELAQKSTVANLFNKEIPPAKFNKIFPCGRLSLIAGDGGSGKTYFALYFALLFVKENPGKTVFLLLAEDDEWTVKRRLERLVEQYPYLDSKNRLNIHYIADRDIEVAELDTFSKKIIYREKSELRETIRSYDVSIIDPLVNLLPADENDNFSAKEFCKLMKGFVWGTDKSLVFLHHVAKGDLKDLTSESLSARKLTDTERVARAVKIRGAGAFLTSARYAIYVEKQENTAIVSVVKNNYGKPGKILSKLDLPEIETGQDENFPENGVLGLENQENQTFREENSYEKPKNEYEKAGY